MPVICQWTAHPARRRPRDLALAVAVISVTSAVVLMSFESLLLAALAALILCVSIGPFLLPTRYTVTEDGIEAERAFTRRSRRFADLRRVEAGPHAALVSPFSRRHVLDRFRGMLVLLDGADRERVLATLQERIRA